MSTVVLFFFFMICWSLVLDYVQLFFCHLESVGMCCYYRKDSVLVYELVLLLQKISQSDSGVKKARVGVLFVCLF